MADDAPPISYEDLSAIEDEFHEIDAEICEALLLVYNYRVSVNH